jgi:hypothetical protein
MHGKAKHRDLQSSLCSRGHAELKGNKAELFKENPQLQACEDGGRFTIDSRLEIHDFCPRSSAELTDDPMKEVPSDISESE